MVNLEIVEYKKGPRGRPVLTQPTKPEKVLRIVYLRDFENMRWRQIGELLGLSHQAPFLLYKKWAKWAHINLDDDVIDRLRKEVNNGTP